MRLAALCLGFLVTTLAPVSAEPAAQWTTVIGGSNLVRPVFWEGLSGVSATNGIVIIDGQPDAGLLIDRYGPRLDASADFRLVTTVQASTDDLAVIALIDPASTDASRRLEVGLDQGHVVVGDFDADVGSWETFDTDVPFGPLTLGVSRVAGEFEVQVSGKTVTRFADTGLFQAGHVLLGARVAEGSQLTIYALDAQAPLQQPTAVHVDRCAPPRLLVAGPQALWWVWPETGLLRQVGPPEPERAYLVAVSPDGRWVTYYQRSSQVRTDRFVVDTWVMDLATDERIRLVDGNSPIGWIADHEAVVLGERPQLMALVPSGSLEPTSGQLVLADSMRGLTSPDGLLRAGVATVPTGAAGVNVYDLESSELVLSIPTGRGAVQLAWSPDSTHLAYTSGVDSPQGLIWRLRMVDLSNKSVSLLDSTGEMEIHSVIWAPALSGCR
jgi:hypothetical protein